MAGEGRAWVSGRAAAWARLLSAQRIGHPPPEALRPWLRLPPLRDAYDRATLRRWHAEFHGQPPPCGPPRSFTQRMLHRLLHERDPRLRILNDKLGMRRFAAARLGGEAALVPVLGAWDSAAAIPWDDLPRQLVLKVAHGSGMVLHTLDRPALDRAPTLAMLDHWLAQDYHATHREWGYRGIPRRILAEPVLLDADGGNPAEYKVQCFGGVPRLVRIVTGGFGRPVTEAQYDLADGRFLPFAMTRPMNRATPLPPDIPTGAAMAAALSAGFAQLRVDLYRLGPGRWVLGELTPYDSAGRVRFDPPAWDAWLGALWGEALGEGPAPPRPGADPGH